MKPLFAAFFVLISFQINLPFILKPYLAEVPGCFTLRPDFLTISMQYADCINWKQEAYRLAQP